ncbi:hypothetical protein CEXT_759871 [Caerostris extrusa]|uniref:Uncharacterized protein n=1 Tax=Caerostris extrusa TaxID=172846 RepID=A0AAV4MJC6_CAEEX|nr:hypothetical protein CEXT_759871 [Caerostris extrusa]
MEDEDLNKLLKEIDNSAQIRKRFTVFKPMRKPQFICFGVDADTTTTPLQSSSKCNAEFSERVKKCELFTPTEAQGE